MSDYDVWHNLSGWIFATNYDFKELIAIEQVYDKTVYFDLQWLCRRLDRVDLKQGGSGLLFDDEDLEGYYETEKSLDVFWVARRRRKSAKKASKRDISPTTQQSGKSEPGTQET